MTSGVFLMGEDVGETGGIFTVSAGLMQEFGEARVRDTPISEATFVGCGVGAAIAGMRPVVEIQIFDFIALTMDMMVNQAAKFRASCSAAGTPCARGAWSAGGRGQACGAAQPEPRSMVHSNVPGLVVVAPSTPYDAKGLLVSAIRDDNPVVFCEAKLSYVTGKGPVPEALYAIPLGKADVKREGGDVTVIATMAMVPRALAAAETLSREGGERRGHRPAYPAPPRRGHDPELGPQDLARALVVHEAWTTGGFGAEVSALIADKAFMDLDAPMRQARRPRRADALQRRPGARDDSVRGEDYRGDPGARGVLAAPGGGAFVAMDQVLRRAPASSRNVRIKSGVTAGGFVDRTGAVVGVLRFA